MLTNDVNNVVSVIVTPTYTDMEWLVVMLYTSVHNDDGIANSFSFIGSFNLKAIVVMIELSAGKILKAFFQVRIADNK